MKSSPIGVHSTGHSENRGNWRKLVIGAVVALLSFTLAYWETTSPDLSETDAQNTTQTVVLDSATVSNDLGAIQPGHRLPTLDEQQSQTVNLPHLVEHTRNPLRLYKLPFEITRNSPNDVFGLCILRSNRLEGIWLDGKPLLVQPWTTYGQSFRPNPVFQSLPADIAAGQHVLQVVTRSNPNTPNGLSKIQLGDAQTTQRVCTIKDEKVRLREIGSFYLMCFICVIAFTGAFIVRDRFTLYFGLIAGSWILNRLLLNNDQFDMANPFWAALYYLSRPLIAIPLSLYCLDSSNRLNQKTLQWLVAFFTLGYSTFFLTPQAHWNLWMLVFGFISLLLVLITASLMLAKNMKEPGLAITALSAALVFGALANITDILRAFGLVDWAQASLTHWSVPAMCAGLGIMLIENMVKHAGLEKAMSKKLQLDIERQRLLLESQFRMSKVKNEKIAVFEERKRIMREMHDGLGSQLVSASALVRNPRFNSTDVAELIDNAIQELRIFLDVLSTSSEDPLKNSGKSLNVLLAKFRHHIEPVLRSKGISLEWDVDEMPDGLLANDRDRINLLRMVQEALVNAIKHANASKVTLRAQVQSPRVVIEIRDDGKGMQSAEAQDNARQGYGLINMKKRSDLIGAEFSIMSGTHGTRILITLILPEPPSEAAVRAVT